MGSNANVSHTINEDEQREFTNHINGVSNNSALLVAPAPVLAVAQLCTLPLSLFSKLPQIAKNHCTRSTGQLSTFAVVSQMGSCAA